MSKMKEEIKETKNNLKMSWRFIKQSKMMLVYMAVLSIILSIIGVIIPALLAQQLFKLSNNLLSDLLKVSCFIFIVEMLRTITRTLFNKVSELYIIKTVTSVQISMLEELLRIETSELDKNSSGLFVDRIENDAGSIINVFSSLVSYFTDFISDIDIIFSILIISPHVFLYFFITSIIISIIDKKRRNVFFNQTRELRKQKEKITGLISEIVRGVRDLKLLNGKVGIINKTNDEITKINNESIKIEERVRKIRVLYDTIQNLKDLLFIILGIILVTNGKLTISSLLVLYMYRDKINALLRSYDRFIELLKSYNLSSTRVFEILSDYFRKESLDGKELKMITGNIEFKNLSFSYDGENNVLDNISFNIKKGERVGFVGLSGSGKSTIFNLITKLYPVNEGEILIDGININDISYSSLRSNITYIPQSPYIFNLSILDNLKIGNPSATMKEIIEACKKANIFDRIMAFENGFDTILGESGVILSGGEKQRLAIARCLLKNTNILLFDEATSSLDNITQDSIQKAIYGIDNSKTILIIAHRLSTIVHCNKIILVDNGNIVDIGTHQELLNRCLKYQELFKYEEVENY